MMDRNQGDPRIAAPRLGLGRTLSLAVWIAGGLVLWELLIHFALFRQVNAAGGAPLGLGLAADASVFAVASLAATWLGARLGRRLGFDVREATGCFGTASLVAVAFASLMIPGAALRSQITSSSQSDGAGETTGTLLCAPPSAKVGPEAGVTATIRAAAWAALPLQVPVLPLAAVGLALLRKRRSTTRRGRRAQALLIAATGLCATCTQAGDDSLPAPPASGVAASWISSACPAGAPIRSYAVSAINVSMTLNRFGDHDPGAFMYVLDDQIAAVRAEENAPLPDRVSTGLRDDPIQPLVLRANLGDCLVLHFTNRLSSSDRVSLHVDGLPYTAANGGGAVGNNPDTFADPGQSITYALPIPSDPTAERAYTFHDHGDSRELVNHGLFGTVVAEPAGSHFLDARTGAPLTGSGWEAIIAPPPGAGPAFREFVLAYHEVGNESFTGILDAGGHELPQISPLSGTYRPGSRAINYRSEPFHTRFLLGKDESLAYSSYFYGDPATPSPYSYLGEPTKTRLVHAGTEVFHVHHLHGGANRWRRNPEAGPPDFATGLTKVPLQDPSSVHLDAQSIGPGTSFNLEHECGAGGCAQAAGDFLFHCHIQHHYLSGMWAFWRVFDTLQPNLAKLPDRAAPPVAVPSTGLVGITVEGKTLVPRAALVNPATQRALEDFIEAQLPPPGVPIDTQDATVWNWVKNGAAQGPLYLGEPETFAVWANYRSPTPGQRPIILFNPVNGRYTWPLFRPHLLQRPPFPGNGHTGAPWLGEIGTAARPDGLCPNQQVAPDPLRTTRIYPISTIATPIQVTRKQVAKDGLLFVLNEDKAAVLAGQKPKEPLVIRSNVGDCVDLLFTNEVPDDKVGSNEDIVKQDVSKMNVHTHFVQFDPQGSDGVISGMSYEQSLRPHATENRTLQAATGPGVTTITVSNVNRLRPGIWIGVGLGQGMCAPPGGGPQVACTEIRRISVINGTTLTLDQPLLLPHAAGQSVGVEFKRYLWYSDVDSGTVFWHDHVVVDGWARGAFGSHIIEPRGSTWHDPVTGAQVRSGTIVDIHVPPGGSVGAGETGSFRELFAAITDRNKTQEGFVNLRAEPFGDRAGGPARVFSSVTNGDPFTPLPRAYVGDPFVIRSLGVIENIGGLRIAGARFRDERFNPGGAFSDTSFVGISEKEDLVLDGGAGGVARRPGDYLYYSAMGRHFVSGAWGLLRVHDTAQATLKPLPDRPLPPSGAGFPSQTFTGGAPAAATGPGQACPAGATIRHYDVAILATKLVLSSNQIKNGIAYVPDTGSPPTTVREPLVMRANQGECLEIQLRNRLSERAGLHVGELAFDPQGSYGAAIGFNPDSSVAPGATRTYRFFADQELGITVGLDLANPAAGAEGAYGAAIVEPVGSIYRNPLNGAPLSTGIAADIVAPAGTFRELTVLLADDDPRIGLNHMPYPIDVAGLTTLSYSAEPVDERDADDNPSGVFSSAVFGDPKLLIAAPAGMPFTFRVAMPWGEQGHVFNVEGHRFPDQPQIVGSERPCSKNLIPGARFDAPLVGGAGSGSGNQGDYLVYDSRTPFEQAGLWGLLRVTPPAP